jgi:hypothetical protein
MAMTGPTREAANAPAELQERNSWLSCQRSDCGESLMPWKPEGDQNRATSAGRSGSIDDVDQGRPALHPGKPPRACRRYPVARVHRFRRGCDLGNRELATFSRVVNAQSAGCCRGQAAPSLTSRANAGSAVVAPLPVLAIGDRITRPYTLVTPADEIGERSIYVVPSSPITTLGERVGDERGLGLPDRPSRACLICTRDSGGK